jgi:hypothetical protein
MASQQLRPSPTVVTWTTGPGSANSSSRGEPNSPPSKEASPTLATVVSQACAAAKAPHSLTWVATQDLDIAARPT